MMKNIKLIIKTVLFVLGLSVNAQIASNNSINATINRPFLYLLTFVLTIKPLLFLYIVVNRNLIICV